MTDTKCVLIRKQVMLSEQGRVAPCCNFSTDIPIDQYHEKAEEYAKQLDNGIKIPECSLCWETEDKGFTSVRQSGNDCSDTYDGDGITALDIRLHSKCNLACNMCAPGFSTLWAKLKQKDVSNVIPQESVDFALSVSHNLRRLSMQGGEPFYGDEYVEFVDSLPNKQNVALDVFSNMITIDSDVIKRWSDELEMITINASVDGIGDIYEDIRWPTTWKKFERNAISIYKILNQRLMFFYTIQAKNISCIKEFIVWRNENCPDSHIVFSNVLHNDEITYKGLKMWERDKFLSEKEEILSMIENEREIDDLSSLFKLVESINIDDDLLTKRQVFDDHINEMRTNYRRSKDDETTKH